MPIDSLRPFPGNPREGDVRAVVESILKRGQLHPIDVWAKQGGKKIKGGPTILSGNHTWKAICLINDWALGVEEKPGWVEALEKKLKKKCAPWTEIAVIELDCETKEEAEEIVISMNRIPDLGGYNRDKLTEMLGRLSDATGTGYTDEELAMVHRARDAAIEQAVASSEDAKTVVDIVDVASLMEKVKMPSVQELIDDVEEDDTPDPLAEASDTIEGSAFQIVAPTMLPSRTAYEIPYLRDDMMVTDLPDHIMTWAGSATKGIKNPGHWFYNFGVDSLSGIDEESKRRLILSFYCWDDYFQPWWDDTEGHLTRALNGGVQMAVTPNYSQGNMPMANSIFNLYRSRYIGRMMQDVGIKVMPDLEYRRHPMMSPLVRETLPKVVPWAAMQIQNIAGKTRLTATEQKQFDMVKWADETVEVLELVRPKNLLVYGSDSSFTKLELLVTKNKLKINLRRQETRLAALSVQAKMRVRKKKEDRTL